MAALPNVLNFCLDCDVSELWADLAKLPWHTLLTRFRQQARKRRNRASADNPPGRSNGRVLASNGTAARRRAPNLGKRTAKPERAWQSPKGQSAPNQSAPDPSAPAPSRRTQVAPNATVLALSGPATLARLSFRQALLITPRCAAQDAAEPMMNRGGDQHDQSACDDCRWRYRGAVSGSNAGPNRCALYGV